MLSGLSLPVSLGTIEVSAMNENDQLGTIEISPMAIAAIASQAVLECYGIVGMASRNRLNEWVEALSLSTTRRGVDVHVDGERIVVDLYVIVEYGTRISEVAREAMRHVKFNLEKILGIPVAKVNVHVQGLRISNGIHEPAS
jgi:uncharacterized alkaline shock family protein YloU